MHRGYTRNANVTMPENMERPEVPVAEQLEPAIDSGYGPLKWIKGILRQVSQHDSVEKEESPSDDGGDDDGALVRLQLPTTPVIEFGATITGKKHRVFDVVPGSYADELKLKPDDELAVLNGLDLTDLPSQEVGRLFRRAHDEVQLVIRRRGGTVQCGFLASGLRQGHDEIGVKVSCPHFQENIIQTLECSPTLKPKKIYTAYVKSISRSNERRTDCCLKAQSGKVVATPVRNGQEQWHKVRLHTYQSFTVTEGICCVLEIGPNKKTIACRRDARTNEPIVYLSADMSDAKSVCDKRIFIKKITDGRTLFKSATQPNVYLYIDGENLTARQIPDASDIDNHSRFDVCPIKNRELRR